jgi:hypothetical protein
MELLQNMPNLGNLVKRKNMGSNENWQEVVGDSYLDEIGVLCKANRFREERLCGKKALDQADLWK